MGEYSRRIAMEIEYDEEGNPIETGVADPAAGGGEGDKGGEGKTVPLEALQAVRGENKELKDRILAMEQQFSLYRANPQQGGTQGGEQEGKRGGGAESEVLAGMEDDDPITVADAKKLVASVEETVGQLLSSFTVQTQRPDFNEVIQNHLPKVSKNPHLLAYELGKSDPEYQKKVAEAAQAGATQKIEENLGKPGSASAAAGGGGLSKADEYENLSDDELEERIQKVKSRG